MAVYRCQQECAPSAFISLEQHLYRVQWYLRLFAAATVMYGTVMAGLSGTKTSTPEQVPAAPASSASPSVQGVPPLSGPNSKTAEPVPAAASGGVQSAMEGDRMHAMSGGRPQSLWPDAVCEATGLRERMRSLCGDWAAGLLRFAVSPAVLLLMCAWWLPQHPVFQRLPFG